jgi:hypothetical protein
MKKTNYPRSIIALLLIGAAYLATSSVVEAQSPPNQLDRAVTREGAIEECMQGQGWNYTPSLYPGESDEIARSGISKSAQQKRIGIPPASQVAGGPATASGIAEADRDGFMRSYWGADGQDGCKSVGDDAVGKSDPRIRKIVENGERVANMVTDRVASDPRLAAESKRYVLCMSEHGYTVRSGWIGAHELREQIYADAGIGAGGGYDPRTADGLALDAKLDRLGNADGSCDAAWNSIFGVVNREAQIEAWKSVGLG